MKLRQNGFSSAKLFIIVAVVAVFGIAGWSVSAGQKKDKVSDQTENYQNQEALYPEDSVQSYFEIPELGVKFDASKAPEGLYYSIGNNGQTAYFSTEQLKDTECSAEKTAQIALSRFTDEDFYKEFGDTMKDKASKVGEYVYVTMGGQAGCNDDPSIQEKAIQLREKIHEVLPEALVAI